MHFFGRFPGIPGERRALYCSKLARGSKNGGPGPKNGVFRGFGAKNGVFLGKLAFFGEIWHFLAIFREFGLELTIFSNF